MIVALIFATLILIGVLALIVVIVIPVGCRHEVWHGSLQPAPPTVTAALTRLVTGLYVRMPTAAPRMVDPAGTEPAEPADPAPAGRPRGR